jgi:hypothetical protein
MPLLNFPQNVIPGAFTQALVKAEEAMKLMAGPGTSITQLQQAVVLLAESNALLINILTDHQIT